MMNFAPAMRSSVFRPSVTFESFAALSSMRLVCSNAATRPKNVRSNPTDTNRPGICRHIRCSMPSSSREKKASGRAVLRREPVFNSGSGSTVVSLNSVHAVARRRQGPGRDPNAWKLRSIFNTAAPVNFEPFHSAKTSRAERIAMRKRRTVHQYRKLTRNSATSSSSDTAPGAPSPVSNAASSSMRATNHPPNRPPADHAAANGSLNDSSRAPSSRGMAAKRLSGARRRQAVTGVRRARRHGRGQRRSGAAFGARLRRIRRTPARYAAPYPATAMCVRPAVRRNPRALPWTRSAASPSDGPRASAISQFTNSPR